MPSDSQITEEEGETFAAILKHFEVSPDPRCVPLLIGAVAAHTGLGMYEHIKFVLMQLSKEEVVPYLRLVLQSGTDAQKARCCWWAIDIEGWELASAIAPWLDSGDDDLKDAAEAFFELRR